MVPRGTPPKIVSHGVTYVQVEELGILERLGVAAVHHDLVAGRDQRRDCGRGDVAARGAISPGEVRPKDISTRDVREPSQL